MRITTRIFEFNLPMIKTTDGKPNFLDDKK